MRRRWLSARALKFQLASWSGARDTWSPGWWRITRAMDDNALRCPATYGDRLARLGDRGPKAWHNT
jgi:hypothetical protein